MVKPLLAKIVKVVVDKKHQAKIRRFIYLDANQFRIDYGDNIVRRFSEVSVLKTFMMRKVEGSNPYQWKFPSFQVT
jgi:hypothetical protein